MMRKFSLDDALARAKKLITIANAIVDAIMAATSGNG